MKLETIKRKQRDLRHTNGCDWHDCDTCPHDECISDVDEAMKWQRKHKEWVQKSERKRSEYLRKNNLCTRCRKAPALEGKRKCAICAEKARLEAIEYRRKHPKPHKIKDSNLCFICQKNPCYDEHKVCYDCYQVRLRTLKQAKESPAYKLSHSKVSKTNHIFFVKG